jgi:acetoacetyl-[acyl-carrier protein] synthase
MPEATVSKQTVNPTDVLITACGGINAAGRSSGHQAYRRMVFDALTPELQQQTLDELATLTGQAQEHILGNTLVRAWDDDSETIRHWSPDALPGRQRVRLDANESELNKYSENNLDNGINYWKDAPKRCEVRSAGQLPKGFRADNLYNCRHHPRGLQLALYAAADALGSLGMSADDLKQALCPDDIAVYMGSTAGQMDMEGFGGMIQSSLLGERNTSRQLPMGISTMPADFINAYLLGNAGSTGSNNGACASFLYNLRMGLDDIRSGRRKIVFVGNSEAPLLPAIIEGFNAMGALATEERLQKLDQTTDVDFSKASRPFAQNVGFTMAESAQCFVLASRDTALELGLNILGSVGDVFIHADGHKRSISAPGIGNYITLGKALASAKRTLGDEVLNKSAIQAHGSSTPQNRVTESDMFNRLAKEFGIKQWPVTAVKAHLGHSISAASADQLMTTLGSWQHGILPGITTAKEIAADVHTEHLDIPLQHKQVNPDSIQLAFINSKGFGGNNATGWVLSGKQCRKIIRSAVNDDVWNKYLSKNETIRNKQQTYLIAMAKENQPLPVKDKEMPPEPDEINLTEEGMTLPGWAHRVTF